MANRRGKRYRAVLEGLGERRGISLRDAVTRIKEQPGAKFDETMDMAINLNIDSRKSDQVVRGTVTLPHGSGKTVRVCVFAAGDAAEQARAAGADWVGFADLIEKVKGGWTDFDVAVATPAAMAEVKKLGKILGTRGLMPSPKAGTVTDQVEKTVREVKAGRVELKMDKTGILHVSFGKRSFAADALVENARSILDTVLKMRPASVKGAFIGSCAVSSTMSPSVRLDPQEFQVV